MNHRSTDWLREISRLTSELPRKRCISQCTVSSHVQPIRRTDFYAAFVLPMSNSFLLTEKSISIISLFGFYRISLEFILDDAWKYSMWVDWVLTSSKFRHGHHVIMISRSFWLLYNREKCTCHRRISASTSEQIDIHALIFRAGTERQDARTVKEINWLLRQHANVFVYWCICHRFFVIF